MVNVRGTTGLVQAACSKASVFRSQQHQSWASVRTTSTGIGMVPEHLLWPFMPQEELCRTASESALYKDICNNLVRHSLI